VIAELKILYVKHISDTLEQGVLYISKEYSTAIHLCACGCGVKTVTPFSSIIDGKDHGWTFTFQDENTVTLRPSIGNFSGERPYHAHYYITNNKIEWCEPPRKPTRYS